MTLDKTFASEVKKIANGDGSIAHRSALRKDLRTVSAALTHRYAFDDCIKAYDSSTVKACHSSTVEAYDSSTVKACHSSTVTAYDSSTVEAYDSSTVKAWGNAIAFISERSSAKRESIVLMENSTLKDCKTKTIYQAGDWTLVTIDGFNSLQGQEE